MLFNSWEFLIFFPTVLLLFYGLPYQHRWKMLLVASCIFYMAFIPFYLAILFTTIVVDYIAGILIARSAGRLRHFYLLASVVVTCLILFFFKYYDFVALNATWLSHHFGFKSSIVPLGLILPIGLSFHTFQSLSYVIEVYRGNQEPERHFGIYSLYVMFFPQLVAGPIERPQNMLHQFHERKPFNLTTFQSGLLLMFWGLFKKVVIADNLAAYVNVIFHAPGQFGAASMALAIVFFYFQIYCDFSGYSDIAIGSARMMGFDLMKNFNLPFLSKSMTEFWKRWHISLSTWLRDYLYEPLALRWRDHGLLGISVALVCTFLVSGLWHGAQWTFIVWGLAHGVVLAIELVSTKIFKAKNRIFSGAVSDAVGTARTFALVCLSYVFFRAADMPDAMLILRTLGEGVLLFPSNVLIQLPLDVTKWAVAGHDFSQLVFSGGLIFFLIIIEKLQAEGALAEIGRIMPTYARVICYQILLLSLVFFGTWFAGKTSFIYFQF